MDDLGDMSGLLASEVGGRTLAWMTLGTCQGCWQVGGRILAWMTYGTCHGCWQVK